MHIDIDAFFASAEQAYDARLKDRPMAVGNRSNLEIFRARRQGIRLYDDNSGAFVAPVFYSDARQSFEEYFVDVIDGKRKVRGIITSASYEARECGVKTGMPVAQALRLCPEMIVIPANYRRYHELSQRLYRYLMRRIPAVEQYSIDEFFGDLSGWVQDERCVAYAAELQCDIKKYFDLPVSIGIAQSKWIAKLATEYAKPFGIYLVDDIDAFIETIPIEDFPGIGKGFARRLREHRIKTLGQLKRSKALVYRWKKPGRVLYARVTGQDGEGISAAVPRKSIGISRTFDPLTDNAEIKRRIAVMARHIAHMAMRYDADPSHYYLGIKYQDRMRVRCRQTLYRIFSERLLKQTMLTMYDKCALSVHPGVIKLTLRVSGFERYVRFTPSLLTIDEDMQAHRLTQALFALRERFGLDIVKSANEL